MTTQFNTTNLLPATGYYNKLMRDIDEAAWLGNNADTLENIADDVKQYVDMGATWYPKF
jgi:hypothetical protein|tara:strand:+ start:1480 stop:1656 length:177 start_codon:yes stop_codon:yes gene_type:complete